MSGNRPKSPCPSETGNARVFVCGSFFIIIDRLIAASPLAFTVLRSPRIRHEKPEKPLFPHGRPASFLVLRRRGLFRSYGGQPCPVHPDRDTAYQSCGAAKGVCHFVRSPGRSHIAYYRQSLLRLARATPVSSYRKKRRNGASLRNQHDFRFRLYLPGNDSREAPSPEPGSHAAGSRPRGVARRGGGMLPLGNH